jgi:putative ABC transport system substrate-binding protein
MRRRDFITLGGAAAAWPLTARAQQPAMPVIGFLGSDSPDVRMNRLRAFRQGLGEAGFVEGRNVAIEYRWAEDQVDRMPALAADLVRRQVAVIAALGGIPSAMAAKAATMTIPAVFLLGANPVELGLVASLSRPGGNLTGVSTLNLELGAKRLELLHELVPAATVIALLVNPTSPNAEIQSKDLQAAAGALGRQLRVLHASTERDFDMVFASLAQLRIGALVIGAGAPFSGRGEQLAALAVRHAVPTMFWGRDFATAGGLMSYGGSFTEAYQPSGRRLHRPHSQGREAGRLAGAAGHQGRADHQPQDRQGARHRRPAAAARPRRRGDRVNGSLHVSRHMQGSGPRRPI